jgi:hypothetical protein
MGLVPQEGPGRRRVLCQGAIHVLGILAQAYAQQLAIQVFFI